MFSDSISVDSLFLRGILLKQLLIVSLTVIIIVALILASAEMFLSNFDLGGQIQNGKASGFYIGVSFCGNTAAEAKLLIDRVKSFTNFFVLLFL